MPYKRRQAARRPARKFPTKTNRVKKMVGEQLSLVDKIASGVGSVARLAGAIAPIIASINTEEKYIDNTALVSITNSPGNIIPLTGTAQGVTDNTRIGDSVKARFLQLRMYFTPDHSSLNNNLIRMMLIADKSISASMSIGAPTLAQIFASSTNVFSPLNKDNGDRFVILKDKTFTLNCPTSPNVSAALRGGDSRYMKINLPLDFHIRYAAPNVTDLSSNNIFLILWTSSGASPTCTYYSRFKFTDN